MNQGQTENNIIKYGGEVEEKEFLFSIIIPIYNVEKYIAETIESVINQTLDFKQHVHIIIVNDGSPDKSEEVCIPYLKEYPKNITYVKKENGGVSSARNLGLKYVKGEYVNFLDSDDKLEENVLEEVYDFFTKNKDEIDLVAIPMQFFDAVSKPHILNYKFKETGIIDINENPDFFQLSSSSCFVKNELAKKFSFDERLKYSEDAKYITEILLEKMKYGVLSDVQYLYRKRQDESSAVQNGPRMKAWYTESLTYFSEALINYSLKKFNEVPLYIQYLIMYDLQWRFRIKDVDEEILNDREKSEYLQKLIDILGYIQNNVIFDQRNIGFHLKVYVVKLKYDNSSTECIRFVKVNNDVKVYLDNIYLSKLSSERVLIDLIEVRDNQIILEGKFGGSFPEKEIKIDVLLNHVPHETIRVNRAHETIKFLGNTVKEVYGFKTKINIADWKANNQIHFRVSYNDIAVLVQYDLEHNVNFSKSLPSYYAKDKLLLHSVKNYINVIPNTFFRHLKKELGMFKRLFKKMDKYALQAIFVRTFYHFYKFFNRKPIHLYMDRVIKAGDNAEQLFKYSLEQKDGINKLFILSKESPDYERLSKIGNIIPYGSRKHRFYMLLADKLISSHADEFITNPFGNKGVIHYNDLMDYDFIFLQHGIIVHDLSAWLHKHNKNIKMFVTSSQSEYDSIVEGKYNYSEKEVKLVGLPRFDLLQSRPEKKILIMPTWRKELAGNISPTGEREYNSEFKNSLYYHTFNKLLNDEILLNTAEKYGYKIIFYPHPNIIVQLKDFNIPSSIEIADKASDYSDYFNSSNLLITDYSSVAYDFSYQKKPIIYYHFESIHWDMGYFDYDKMGFGEVHSTHEGLVNKIKNYLESNCEMEPMYKERVSQFYKFTDTNNRKRVYDEINRS